MTSSENQTKLPSKEETYQLRSFILPIDWTKKPIVGMSLKIPESFKSVLPLNEAAMADTNEYILTQESIDNWSQIITVNKLIGKGIQAEKYNDLFLKLMSENSSKFKVINKETYRIADNRVSVARVIAEYTNNGQQEMILSYTVSGPLDAVNLQYTVVINDKMSKESAMRLFDNFIKKQTAIITRN